MDESLECTDHRLFQGKFKDTHGVPFPPLTRRPNGPPSTFLIGRQRTLGQSTRVTDRRDGIMTPK